MTVGVEHNCPDCGAPLASVPSASHILACPSCDGRVYGLAPFERMLNDGVGARIWMASASGPPGSACPYCSKPMHRPEAAPGAPEGLAVCRLCQEVWVPGPATAWMVANGATAPEPMAPALPATCANCGAPYEPDESGHCKYCQAQIGAPAPVVVFVPDTRF
ncbi:MAG TPA: hypothetical protein VG435_00340 [Acidimicrobiales bacterium]|jgi:DNA-directed RNA polymerase subunit RPC12/RpoP|nr:hypothetical protein [Acidimicrobiales bacterium]